MKISTRLSGMFLLSVNQGYHGNQFNQVNQFTSLVRGQTLAKLHQSAEILKLYFLSSFIFI